MKKIFFLLIIIFFLFSIRSLNIYQLYCQYGGGIYYVNSTGEFCIVNGIAFNAIDYYNNLVPPQYSFCSHFNSTLIEENITIDNYTLEVYYCKFANGTLISPYQIFSEFIRNLTTTQSTCSNILQCPNTPWEVPQCSDIPYPCFNPPYIPYNLYNGNKTLYQQTLYVYRQEFGCGKCNSYDPWYVCPYNYSLNELYQQFLKKCPPPNIVEINCYGEFTCINTSQNYTSPYQQISEIIEENEMEEINNTTNNNNFIIPVIITIIVIIVGLIILLYYLK